MLRAKFFAVCVLPAVCRVELVIKADCDRSMLLSVEKIAEARTKVGLKTVRLSATHYMNINLMAGPSRASSLCGASTRRS